MRYFDSPKNRAFWEREMVTLRRKREERQSGKYPEREKEQEKTKKENNFNRIRVTYEELLKMEADAISAEKGERRKAPVRTKEAEKVREKEKTAERSLGQ